MGNAIASEGCALTQVVDQSGGLGKKVHATINELIANVSAQKEESDMNQIVTLR